MFINQFIDLFVAWWGVVCAIIVIWALKQGKF